MSDLTWQLLNKSAHILDSPCEINGNYNERWPVLRCFVLQTSEEQTTSLNALQSGTFQKPGGQFFYAADFAAHFSGKVGGDVGGVAIRVNRWKSR